MAELSAENGLNRCPHCGGSDIETDAAAGKLKCKYCQTLFDANSDNATGGSGGSGSSRSSSSSSSWNSGSSYDSGGSYSLGGDSSSGFTYDW